MGQAWMFNGRANWLACLQVEADKWRAQWASTTGRRFAMQSAAHAPSGKAQQPSRVTLCLQHQGGVLFCGRAAGSTSAHPTVMTGWPLYGSRTSEALLPCMLLADSLPACAQ